MTTTMPCLHITCSALLLAGRGYCARHGGPIRLRRELAEAGEENRRADALAAQAASATWRAAKVHRQVRLLAPGDRRGGLPGQGLSRFRRPQLDRRAAA